MADRRRQYLWKWTALRRTESAFAFPRDRDPDFEEQGPGARSRAGAGAFAGAAQNVRLERGVGDVRHGRACPGHPRLLQIKKARRGCPARRPGMTKVHTVNRAPSCPFITSVRTAPGVSPAIATGRKCSVRPCVALSISTRRVAPISEVSRFCTAASAAARNLLGRALIGLPETCGIVAACVPGRLE